MSQTLTPARVSSPGRILSRELNARGWTQKDLAEIMGRPPQVISEIVQGKKQITPETAIELAGALGTSAEFWTNLETKYRLHIAQKAADSSSRISGISRKGKLYSVAPVAEMQKRGWIPTTDSIDDLEAQVCKFFSIDRLEDRPKLAVNFRQSENREPKTSAQRAWVKRVENIAQVQSLPVFDRARLNAAIPEILTYANSAENVALVPEKLRSLGIHFVIVPHLGKTYLDGAALPLENNPVIALTLRYKRIDNFWFTLMHEIGHLALGHPGGYLDDMDNLGVDDREQEANQFAADWLLNPEELRNWLKILKKKPSAKRIETFAQLQHRHPGILVGRLQRKGIIPYQYHRKFLINIDQYLENEIDT